MGDMIGESPRTYRLMVRLVKDKEADNKKPGLPPKLIGEQLRELSNEYETKVI